MNIFNVVYAAALAFGALSNAFAATAGSSRSVGDNAKYPVFAMRSSTALQLLESSKSSARWPLTTPIAAIISSPKDGVRSEVHSVVNAFSRINSGLAFARELALCSAAGALLAQRLIPQKSKGKTTIPLLLGGTTCVSILWYYFWHSKYQKIDLEFKYPVPQKLAATLGILPEDLHLFRCSTKSIHFNQLEIDPNKLSVRIYEVPEMAFADTI